MVKISLKTYLERLRKRRFGSNPLSSCEMEFFEVYSGESLQSFCSTASGFGLLKTVEKGGDTAGKNNIKFLQYYCSNFDEKMRYFEVKSGNKK